MSGGIPYLSVSKLDMERIEDKNRSIMIADPGGRAGDAEMLKGTWSWMRRDLESIRKDNEEMLGGDRTGSWKGSKATEMSEMGRKDLKSANSGENVVDFLSVE
ncbi:hypothetical protein MLD38_023484 [Melastoma candidum]|uniref:Uncharacterized protein n=1 Tax=Melastoma candidum TaxID=119954 RepID=A0ACB9NVX0_9MYRT|nr:hypothetical protein MLD38_023484 [Melastoma candidum]